MKLKYNSNEDKRSYGVRDLENCAKETKMTFLAVFGCFVIGLVGNCTSNSFGNPYYPRQVAEQSIGNLVISDSLNVELNNWYEIDNVTCPADGTRVDTTKYLNL